MGDSYRFDIFHTERNPCSSELFFEVSGVQFTGIDTDADSPPIDYTFHVSEDMHVGGVLNSFIISDAFSVGPIYEVTILSGKNNLIIWNKLLQCC